MHPALLAAAAEADKFKLTSILFFDGKLILIDARLCDRLQRKNWYLVAKETPAQSMDLKNFKVFHDANQVVLQILD